MQPSETEKAENRRKFPRFNFRESVEYHIRQPYHNGGCLACDLSEGGIKVNFNEFVPVNTEVELRVRFKDNPNVVNLTGRVAWVRQIPASDRYQLGIEFAQDDLSLPASSNKDVYQYIRSHRFKN